MADWTIKIFVDDANGKTYFQPNLGGFTPGQALPTQQDDTVSWNNKTNDTHQPWPTDSNYNPIPDSTVRPPTTPPTPNYMYPLYMSDPIPPGQSSNPAYDILLQNSTLQDPKNGTIYYFCLSHPNEITERGTITVSSVPVIPQ